MIIFKNRQAAMRWCNAFNTFPWFNLMVTAVPGGWTLTRASGVNNSVKAQ